MKKTGIRTLALTVIATCGTYLVVWAMTQNENARTSTSLRPLSENAKEIYKQALQLTGRHREMGKVRPGDWLESHQEFGQTFNQYANDPHVELTKDRNVLYVLPLGDFSSQQMKIVKLSAEFLGHYFMCEVKILDNVGLDVIPQTARRVHPNWGVRQIHSGYVLHDLLPPMIPDNAVALIALTASDLYPKDDWNFVFGQASLAGRVGVWSLFRNGDPESEFKTVLSRTLKTASHETGHMFSIQHCIAYQCNLCGSNSLDESDRRPLHLCPECLAKVLLATHCNAVERFEKLGAFCREHELTDEADFYAGCIEQLK